MLQMRPNFLVVMPEDVTSLIRYILEDEGYDISTPEGVGHDFIRDRDKAVDLVILGVAFYERQNGLREQATHLIGGRAKPMLLLVEQSGFPKQASFTTDLQSIAVLRRPLTADKLISHIRTLLSPKAKGWRTDAYPWRRED